MLVDNNTRMNYDHTHLLAKGRAFSTDSWKTGMNNNVLIVGPTGAGKTRNYVIPNILHSEESMIITDTKGALYERLKPQLEAKGYRVLNLNFMHMEDSCGYNPLDYIRRDPVYNTPRDEDIMSVVTTLGQQVEDNNDPFWYLSAEQYLSFLIHYVMEIMPNDQRDFSQIFDQVKLIKNFDSFYSVVDLFSALYPNEVSGATTICNLLSGEKAEKTLSCIIMFVTAMLMPLSSKSARAMYRNPDKIDFSRIGREKTALFITISDTDRSLDTLATLFVTQALQCLCREADNECEDHRLAIPVRFYLDDFATNMRIGNFEDIISVIRSREISVSIVLQNISQLDKLYGHVGARTIINNCDRQLYLGVQDVETARYVSVRSDIPLIDVIEKDRDQAYLFVRGEKAIVTEKCDPVMF